MTSSTITGWIGGVSAGVGSLFFLATNPDAERHRVNRPTMLHVAADSSQDETADQTLTAEQTLRRKVELLERGRDLLLSKPGYTARFEKQEVVDGELQDEQAMLLKCRHEPFSVYLAWEHGNVGREVLFVEGENNGKFLVHEGGWKKRLPTMSLKPDSSLAMQDARYPVTAAGLLGLVNIMLTTHQQDLDQGSYASCEQQPRHKSGERSGIVFTTRYKSAAASPVYRKSITFIDDEWSVPLETHHFGWPKQSETKSEQALDEVTLIESYRFDDVDFSYQPLTADFDRSNPEYHFQ